MLCSERVTNARRPAVSQSPMRRTDEIPASSLRWTSRIVLGLRSRSLSISQCTFLQKNFTFGLLIDMLNCGPEGFGRSTWTK
jgi:hypothetical protein